MVLRRLKITIRSTYHLLKVTGQIVYGIWKLSKFTQPIVTIFGGARIMEESPYSQQAHELAARFVEEDISVLTGGGGGVMKAANCGAVPDHVGDHGRSIGIGVKDLGEERNPCSQIYFELDYFFARKWLLTRFAIAFVVFPGGFGTLDELAEILTLIKTKKLHPVPIVLVGVDYWKNFMAFVQDAINQDMIAPDARELFTITDDLNEVFEIVHDECKDCAR